MKATVNSSVEFDVFIWRGDKHKLVAWVESLPNDAPEEEKDLFEDHFETFDIQEEDGAELGYDPGEKALGLLSLSGDPGDIIVVAKEDFIVRDLSGNYAAFDEEEFTQKFEIKKK